MGFSLELTNEDRATILLIGKRARELGGDRDVMSTVLDVAVCHCNGCPLDLDRLLVAEEFDFFHDLVGIRRHIDHDNGTLHDGFLPRFATKAVA